MKIFSKEQIYEGDRLTIERQNISSTDLMERAGSQIFNWMHLRMQGAQVPIHVFCGIGNNGGDGLVLSRQLILDGYNVKTYIVNYSDKRSKDFLINYDRIKNVTKKWPELLTSIEDFPEIQKDDIIVDAIFGIGLNRPVDTWVKDLFVYLNETKAFTLSIDIPSGLQTDQVPVDETAVIKAGYTLSFVTPKLVFFLPETSKYTQQWETLDIGIDPEFLYTTTTEAELIGKHEVLPIYKPRDKFSHKVTYGHSVIIGGSYGKTGAVTLASRAALSAGSGLITAYVPKCGYIPLQTAFPEAMVLTSDSDVLISNINFDIKASAIGIGMGLGTAGETVLAFEGFLKSNTSPLVIDADALNIISENKNLLKLLPKQSVLTPHPKELERLVGVWKDDFYKLDKVKSLSKTYDLIVVIKGANTITVYQDKLYINTTGNPGLATAGTGDVLTGIITGLISQSYEPLTAAIFGVYLHGKSADIAVEDYGYQSLIASHIIDYLGEAFKDLFKQPEQAPQANETTEES
ncbi:bifunctional ADP-dependent NAD(P)H-hydrate dehydratase/NAD(P)H-hydrate epimerase [Siansivirga zeaxanthinifaciens]|uniref:Bifunctional NAD(P)H-hydrate repair enzyme n=1 Tax=Siansivirga zeaxanthinifaciens CC-SAMT-1 TaxID=1454006 RepID=A0A0C5WMW9_9FLAO|nr:bifunctional ADP-dependent NAD(P)H-hydrate dehydratase/NAD(P)H-hydrate epimerase [Siansivirga zeaxanthinifaciens]AJR04200.1 carbohydrate kinase [Siansivirga zeaxanthinifaciens CC-SAMT-1]